MLTVVIQPLAQTFSLLSDSHYGLVEVDDEENIEKEEQQEDKKNELQILNLCNYHLEYGIRFSTYSSQNMYCSLHMEILIPPPDMA
ncbi:hypothetical protein [Aquimarina sp. MAR_2010_214]|uniref:hypothetical protein n=1 Tax=Aquimarina sp. MAR_2010_214 TaxID=1250026 RepID=UPI001178A43E|nr:hypothetical protein [Aquimarina sp. MAR_2010_214]